MAPKPLTPQQKQAAALMAIGSTDSEVAQTAGVAVSTVKAWKLRADFSIEVDRCVGEAQRLVLRRGMADAAAAQGYLRGVIDSTDPAISTSQKIQAASKLLDRMPAPKPVTLAEPVREVPALPSAATPAMPPSSVLEIVKVMREIESMRKRTPSGPSYSADTDDDDEDDEPCVRLVQSWVVQDEPEPDEASDEPQTDDPAGAMGASAGSSPVEPEPRRGRQNLAQPKTRTIAGDEDLLRQIARQRGGLGSTRNYLNGGN